MHSAKLSGLFIASILVAGCATQGGDKKQEDDLKFHVSDRAMEIIDEQGKASATMLGYVQGTDTDLICERFYKTGSHITTNVCYTRAERERRLLNHQETWRDTIQGGPCLPAVSKVHLTRTGRGQGLAPLGGRGGPCLSNR